MFAYVLWLPTLTVSGRRHHDRQPVLSKPFAWKLCPFGVHTLCYWCAKVTFLGWRHFLLLGRRTVPVDTPPRPSAQSHAVIRGPAPWSSRRISRLPLSSRKRKERPVKLGFHLLLKTQSLRKRLPSFSTCKFSQPMTSLLFFFLSP